MNNGYEELDDKSGSSNYENEMEEKLMNNKKLITWKELLLADPEEAGDNDENSLKEMASKSNECKALEFHNITFNEEGLIYNGTIEELGQSFVTTQCYLTHMCDCDIDSCYTDEEISKAFKYKAFTEPYRSSDIATLNYCGANVIVLIWLMLRHIEAELL
jgi:hypothetical protein